MHKRKKLEKNKMWYKPSKGERILYVARGCPGSGKSFLSKQIAGKNGKVFSSDEFFMDGDEYKFDVSKLHQAHNWNHNRIIEAIQSGVTPIILDNTNCQAWEPKKAVQAALENGYRIEIVEPDTSWKFDIEELMKRNTHNVPRKTLERMLRNWQPDITVEDILNSKSPFDKD
jgi:predicted kinase